ncbi:uncharacterized protein LOC103861205 [Brassica rapa]|uniref:Ethylene-responsive nuclear family protein n=1 Tax=Brassica napus TaxID=3708 RepID=A0ABQ8E101_BRANA|nr:uncharacterized protein LOC103861205 [Brassica rapa]XP_013737532.1 uncharacterized protein LOC106440421 [Brassica napus]KAH0935293.1 hypothetical protein HID58_012410 [Brassica napus]
MPLPWNKSKSKSKSGRISRFVSDLRQSPKRGGSLVVETGFPTSLIDLFVKNRDRLNKSSSKRNNNNNNSNKAQTQTVPTRRLVSSPPPPSLPQKLDPPSEDLAASKIEECLVAAENRDDSGNDHDSGNRRGGGCVLMVVAVKIFMVAVLALSTKKLAAGITLSAFSLLFLERVFTLLNLCPDAQVRLGTLIGKLIGRKRIEKLEESSSSQRDKVSFEIIESVEESRDCVEEREVQMIRDVVVLTKEKSKSAKLRSKIAKKIVPKKLRSYKKNRKMKLKEKEQAVEVVEEEESLTEVSSLYSEDRVESKVSEGDEIGSNPPLLESCEEIEEEEEEEESKGDLTKAIVLMIVIALAGLLSGKVVAIGLTLSSCLILRLVCCKSQTSL